MRIKHYLLLALVLSPVAGFTQLLLGARGGYNISSVSFINDIDQRPIYNGLADAGLVVKYYDLTYFGFQGEMNFTQRGYRAPIDDQFFMKRVNSYLELPIYMQVRFKQKNFFVHLNAGFYLSFLLSAKEGTNENGEFEMMSYEFNILRDHRVDYGLPGGVGIGYDFNWGTIQLEVKYVYGLGDLFKYNYEGNPSRSPAWVQNISLSYMYNLSKKRDKKASLKEKIIFEDGIENIKTE